MEAQTDAFLTALSAEPSGSAPLLCAASQPDLRSLLSVLPRKRHASLARALLANVRALAPAPADEAARRAAAAIIGHCLRDKKAPTPAQLREAAEVLVGEVSEMGSAIGKNAVVKLAEVFWEDGREGREGMVLKAGVVLLERSLAVESGGVSSAEDVRRVYALRKAFCDGADGSSGLVSVVGEVSEKLRGLALRCVSSPHYLRLQEGQKFAAWVLASVELGEEAHAALLGMLPSARKSQAVAVGAVYVLAWKYAGLSGIERFEGKLQDVLKKAVYAGQEPLATNLRTVLSSFHANKKLSGMDRMLHVVYTPVLFRCLTAANPLVRRNAVVILADSFPIHDPEMSNAELETMLDEQSGKLFMLLEDPAPLVRVSAVEGLCRVLGLLWDLVPPAVAKKMVHVMTGTLAFDKTSANVRAAVCGGLRFMLSNHQTHPLLSVALPRLGNMVHDKVERVRVCFLNLLIELKAKRIVSARYFDIVPLEELLQRLLVESPAITTKIMQLLVSSFFPLARKNKTRSEIAESQIRACLEMIRQNPASAQAFYENVSMYIAPGPLVEFCIRLSSIAMEERAPPSRKKNVLSSAKEKSSAEKKTSSRVSARGAGGRVGTGKGSSGPGSSPSRNDDEGPCDNMILLGIVATVLQSVSPSLAKSSNAEMQQVVVDIFGGGSLKTLLLPGRNSLETRLTCMKIAGCIPANDVSPVVSVWREQFEAFVEPLCAASWSQDDLAWVGRALNCGFCWRETRHVADVVSGWADTAFSGRRAALAGTKTSKRSRRSGSNDVAVASTSLRIGAVRALCAVATGLVEMEEAREGFHRIVGEEGWRSVKGKDESSLPPALRIVSAIRRGAIAALDSLLEDGDEDGNSSEVAVLECMRATLRLSVVVSETACDKIHGTAELVSRCQLNVLETIQWATGPDVLSAAYSRSHDFGDSLVNIVMCSASDAAALGKLPLSLGISYLADFVSAAMSASNRSEKSSSSGTCRCLRFALDALTAAYHLKVQIFSFRSSATSSGPGIGATSSPAPVPCANDEGIQRLLCIALRALGRCDFSAHVAGSDGRVSRFAEFLLFLSYSEDLKVKEGEAILDAVAEALQPSDEPNSVGREGPADVRESALTKLLALALLKLAMKPPRGFPKSCGGDLASLLLRVLDEKRIVAMALLSKSLADEILDEFHDTTQVPAEVFNLCTHVRSAFVSINEKRDVVCKDQSALFDSLEQLQPSLADLKDRSDATAGSVAGVDTSKRVEIANSNVVSTC